MQYKYQPDRRPTTEDAINTIAAHVLTYQYENIYILCHCHLRFSSVECKYITTYLLYCCLLYTKK